jgi:hypothetical protein
MSLKDKLSQDKLNQERDEADTNDPLDRSRDE